MGMAKTGYHPGLLTLRPSCNVWVEHMGTLVGSKGGRIWEAREVYGHPKGAWYGAVLGTYGTLGVHRGLYLWGTRNPMNMYDAIEYTKQRGFLSLSATKL